MRSLSVLKEGERIEKYQVRREKLESIGNETFGSSADSSWCTWSSKQEVGSMV